MDAKKVCVLSGGLGRCAGSGHHAGQAGVHNEAAPPGCADLYRGALRPRQGLFQLHHRAGAHRDADRGCDVPGRARGHPQRVGLDAFRQAGDGQREATGAGLLSPGQGDAGGAVCEVQSGARRLLRPERLRGARRLALGKTNLITHRGKHRNTELTEAIHNGSSRSSEERRGENGETVLSFCLRLAQKVPRRGCKAKLQIPFQDVEGRFADIMLDPACVFHRAFGIDADSDNSRRIHAASWRPPKLHSKG